jgi:hypothetical protein
MAEAARRAGVQGADVIRKSLRNAGVPLVAISQRAFAVEEANLEAYLASRGGELKTGRPRKKSQLPDD